MSRNLNENHKQELKEIFDMFDSDKSGSISTKELQKVVAALGIKASPKDITDLMKLMDEDGSGSISFKEFSDVMGEQFYREPSTSEFEEAFRCFDNDNSGYISEDELFTVMSKFRKVSHADVKTMIHKVDKDNDGKINIQEFLKMMKN